MRNTSFLKGTSLQEFIHSLVITFTLTYQKKFQILVWESCSVMSNFLWPHGTHSLWNSPDQNTRVGSLSLLQWIFPTQGSNSGLQHCRRILYQLSHQGSPRILEWVAIPSPADLPDPGIEPGSPALQADFTSWARSTSITNSKESLHICLCFQVWHLNSIRWKLKPK